MRLSFILVVTLACLYVAVDAQDPAQGWLGYAKGVSPGSPYDVITYIEMYWEVPNYPVKPTMDDAYAFWFGIETSDNLNLIQPILYWFNEWYGFNEYYQWSPEVDNQTVAYLAPNPANRLYANITYQGDTSPPTYKVIIENLSVPQVVTMVIPIQTVGTTSGDGEPSAVYKRYTTVYVVHEHITDCNSLPPNDYLAFHDIYVEWGNVGFPPIWTTGIVDDYCSSRATNESYSRVSLSWLSRAQGDEK